MKTLSNKPFASLSRAVSLFSIVIFLLDSPAINGQSQLKPVSDPEQQQLEWCFIYSNMLGYDLNYISNPLLYDNVSRWLGTPYKYAGLGKNGIDCSGLVCKLIKDSYNINIRGTSKDLYKQTQNIEKRDLREGDLVFFKIRKGKISHVGVYLGKNKFAHASTSLGVTVSDLDEPYYLKYYYSAGRLKSK